MRERDYWRTLCEDEDGNAIAKVIPLDQWERIAAVVRAVLHYGWAEYGDDFNQAIDALTPDDIEAVQP